MVDHRDDEIGISGQIGDDHGFLIGLREMVDGVVEIIIVVVMRRRDKQIDILRSHLFQHAFLWIMLIEGSHEIRGGDKDGGDIIVRLLPIGVDRKRNLRQGIQVGHPDFPWLAGDVKPAVEPEIRDRYLLGKFSDRLQFQPDKHGVVQPRVVEIGQK